MAKHTDVLIIGAGIIGCGTAYYLAKQGVSVTVLEREMIGHGGSCRNAGGVRQSARDIRELPLAMYSVSHIWPSLTEELGVDVEYHQAGNLRLGLTEKHMEILHRLADNCRRWWMEKKPESCVLTCQRKSSAPAGVRLTEMPMR